MQHSCYFLRTAPAGDSLASTAGMLIPGGALPPNTPPGMLTFFPITVVPHVVPDGGYMASQVLVTVLLHPQAASPEVEVHAAQQPSFRLSSENLKYVTHGL